MEKIILSAMSAVGAQDLTLYRKGDTWGFADRQKRIVVPVKYDSADRFSEGIGRVGEGRLQEAADLFQQSILADSTYRDGHYDLACTLATLAGKGEQYNEEELYDELDIAVAIDAIKPGEGKGRIKEIMGKDPRLDPIRDSNRFKILFASEETPVKIGGTRDLLAGNWANYDDTNSMRFTDTTYTFYSARGFSKPLSEGSWVLDEDGGNLSPNGERIQYPYFDRTQKKVVYGMIHSAEFDPAHLEIKFMGGEKGTEQYREIVLQKLTPPSTMLCRTWIS